LKFFLLLGGLCDDMCAPSPFPHNFFVFYLVHVISVRLMRSPCYLCLCISPIVFVFYAVRVVSVRLVRSSCYLRVSVQIVFCFLCGSCRIGEVYEITLLSVCIPRIVFVFYAVRVVSKLKRLVYPRTCSISSFPILHSYVVLLFDDTDV
jgi:hypothetical protein